MKFINDNITLYNGDSNKIVPTLDKHDLMLLDPPFDEWDKVNYKLTKNIIAFCNPQSRHIVENILGKPRTELVWHFADGRWVSKNLPRITHDYIYIYGDVSNASVGEKQKIKTVNKGISSIGKDKLGSRRYTPNDRKQLNSVQIYPRNMSNPLGAWGKPYQLIYNLLAWLKPESVLDPYAGSGVTMEACINLNIKCTGIEIDKKHFNIAKDKIIKTSSQKDIFRDLYKNQQLQLY